MSHLNLRKPWHTIHWDAVAKEDLSSLPKAYQKVLVAAKFQNLEPFIVTCGYWNKTFFDDVCFTIECPNQSGLYQYATSEIVAWQSMEKEHVR